LPKLGGGHPLLTHMFYKLPSRSQGNRAVTISPLALNPDPLPPEN
jgi:hypothetical protein